MRSRIFLKNQWVWLGIFIVLYSISGVFIVPRVARHQLVKYVQEDLGRKLEMEELKFNPYALSVTLRGGTLFEKQDGTFVSVEELYINLETVSLFRWALVFKEIRITSPSVQITLLNDGKWNFSDLISESSDEDIPVEKTEEDDSGLFRLVINHLEVISGNLGFVDNTQRIPFSINLMPLSLEVNDFSTLPDRVGPYALVASTNDGAKLAWSGNLSVSPIKSDGRLVLEGIKARTLWRYIQDKVAFTIPAGTLKVKTDYQFEYTDNEPLLMLSNSDIALEDLQVTLTEVDPPLLLLPEVLISGLQFDLSKKNLLVPQIRIAGGQTTIQRDTQGRLNWQKLLPANDKNAEEAPDQEKAGDLPLNVRLDTLNLNTFSFLFEDLSLPTAARLKTEIVDLKISNFTTKQDAPFDLALNLIFEEKGNIELTGQASAFPPGARAEIEIKGLPLSPFQPYVEQVARLQIETGQLNLQGKMNYGEKKGSPDFQFMGRASLDSFLTQDNLVREPFVSWDALKLAKIEAELFPHRLHVESIDAVEPYGKIVIAENGTTNISDILGKEPPAKDETAEGSAEKENTRQLAMPVAIDVIRIHKASASFTDQSLSPQFSAGIENLSGEIKGLSSANLARADVALQGKVGTYGKVNVSGQLNPLSEDTYTDLDVVFSNVELTTLSPYSGKFAGYVIDKGKMTLDLNYLVSKRTLVGENKIIFNQLTLGEKTDSPDALKLPITLAISLLKDIHGNIDVDLPVRGDLDDPKFSLGGIVLKALVNLITKAAASPFSMVAGLVGGDAETMNYIAFSPGQKALNENEKQKLLKLSEALKQRPSLLLEVRGHFHPERDDFAIREAELEQQLTKGKKEPGEPVIPIKAIEKYFKDQIGSKQLKEIDRQFPDKENNDEVYRKVLWEKLVALQPLVAGGLRQLAQDRAIAVKDLLVEQGGLEDSRIYILESTSTPEEKDGAIRTTLNLNGS